MKTDALGYAIKRVLSQLTLKTSYNRVVTKANLSHWYLVDFFSRKIILPKTWYKTYNSEFLAIVGVFKIWRHYLESYKHKILVFTDCNNFCHFMNMKNLSSKQIQWA